MPKCEGPCKREVVGFSWIRVKDDKWKRMILRECFQCRTREPSIIYYVDVSSSMCSWCFGQDIEVVATEDGVQSRCRDCDGTDMWLLEVPTILNEGGVDGETD